MNLLMLMPVDVKVPWTRKSTEQEEHLLCRASLHGKARSGCVCMWRLQRGRLYRHSLSDGCVGPVSNGKGQKSFPSTCSWSLSICMLGKCKARAEFDLRRGLQNAKPCRA